MSRSFNMTGMRLFIRLVVSCDPKSNAGTASNARPSTSTASVWASSRALNLKFVSEMHQRSFNG